MRYVNGFYFSFLGPGRLLTVVNALQEECDGQSKLVLNEFRKHRQLDSALAQVADWLRNASSSTSSSNLSGVTTAQQNRTDPKNLDLLLGELTIMHARAEMYVRFIRRRVQVSIILIILFSSFYLIHILIGLVLIFRMMLKLVSLQKFLESS